MGAWDYGVFDDDSAYDIMTELEECKDIPKYIEKIFDKVKPGEYMGYEDGIAVSVCSAVLDSVLNCTVYRFDGFDSQFKTGKDGKEQYQSFIDSIRDQEYEHLKPKAIKALEHLVSDNSELYELWSGNDDLFPKWLDLYETMIGQFK